MIDRRANRAVLIPERRFVSANADELRLAAIDVGSNSIHMVIAQTDASGGLTTLWRLKEMVGLGRNSFPSHRLSPLVMDRAMATLSRFLEETHRRQAEQVIAVATSAVREAENGGEFIQRVRRELGLRIQVVSAAEEARLIYLGVRHAVDLGSGPHLIFDIGGGSAEFIVGDAQQASVLQSRKLGAARMTNRFIKSDPITPRQREALLAHYEAELGPLMETIREHKPIRAIGTSGTLENLASMSGSGEVRGQPKVLNRSELEELVEHLMKSRAKDRARMRGLDEKRQDQILAGALLAVEVMRRLELKQMEISPVALREGMLLDHLSRHRPELQIRREIPDVRRRSVVDLGRRCHWHRAHAEHVAMLCLQLFEQLKPLHRLGRPHRELIEYAALLHDIGAMIDPRGHHKHSGYLIRNGGLQGFTSLEIQIIAGIARYHRKVRPQMRHHRYAALPKAARRVVRVGAALLRIADGLERTNGRVIQSVRSRVTARGVEVTLENQGDAELEVWSARSRSSLFRRVFDCPILLVCKNARR